MTKIINFAAAAALAATMVAAPVASAQALPPSDSPQAASYTVLTWDEFGNPTSGMIEIDLDKISSEAPFGPGAVPLGVPYGTHTENVGGGTWTYGVTLDTALQKHCFSKYMHATKHHTATAVMGAETKRDSGGSGTWAIAKVTGGFLSGTCNAYWSTN